MAWRLRTKCVPFLTSALGALVVLGHLLPPPIAQCQRLLQKSHGLSSSAEADLLRHIAAAGGASGTGSSANNNRTDAARAAADPCTVLYRRLGNYVNNNPFSGYAYAKPTDVLPCTRSVAYQPRRELGNLRSIMMYFRNFYSLIHIAKRSPTPQLPSNYDIISELQGIGKRRWPYAEAFYAAVSQAISLLNDGHTAIQLSCPPFYHQLALPLVSVIERGRPVVRVAPGVLAENFFSTDAAQGSPFNFNAPAYYGALVVSINGRGAWSFMSTWAGRNGGGFHDPGQRLNNAFASDSWYFNGVQSQRSADAGTFGLRTNNPGVNFVTMRLLRPGRQVAETVRVPWLSAVQASAVPGFATKARYYSTFCHSATSLDAMSKSDSLQLQHGRRDDSSNGTSANGAVETALGLQSASPRAPSISHVMRRRRVVPEYFLVKKPRSAENGPNAGQSNLAAGLQVSDSAYLYPVYKLRDGVTGVVAINTFHVDVGRNVDPTMVIINQAKKSFNLVNKFAKRVIIDLSSNGGGDTLAGWWMISLLVGSNRFPSPRTRAQDFKYYVADTPLVRQMISLFASDWYTWKGCASANEVPYTTRTKSRFLVPWQLKRFGSRGVVGRYTSTFKIAEGTLARSVGKAVPPILGRKPFILFSDGKCFSTCMNFAFFLNRQFGIKTVNIGGLPIKPMQFAGGGGGFIMDDVEKEMYPGIPERLRSKANAPKRFSIQMSFGMRFAIGFFTQKSGAPIEFTYMPARRKISFTMANIADPTLQYQAAARYF